MAFNIVLSINLLPTTIEAINDDPRIIGLLLALNPLFGIIAQPLVGILSDKIWTPIGRRAFFIIVSSPITAICLWFIPEAALLWQLFLLVVLYEFFTDIIIGSDHPLIADLVPPRQRLFVNALIMVAVQLTSFAILRFGLGFVVREYGDAAMYQIGAVAQIVLIMIPAFFLRERPVEKQKREKLTIKRYVMDIWGHPELRKLGMVFFTVALFDNLIRVYMVLFAVNSLGATKAEFGSHWSIMPIVGLVSVLPASLAIEKWLPKQLALFLAILAEILACVLALLANEVSDLFLVALLFGFGMTVKGVTVKPFFTEFIPKDIIGQVSGAMNIFYAVGRTLITYAGGWIVYLMGNDYRSLFYFALAIGILAAGLSLRVTDHRFKQRKEGS